MQGICDVKPNSHGYGSLGMGSPGESVPLRSQHLGGVRHARHFVCVVNLEATRPSEGSCRDRPGATACPETGSDSGKGVPTNRVFANPDPDSMILPGIGSAKASLLSMRWI